MNIKNIYNKSLFYLTVPKCVCCREALDIEEYALCRKCILEYENIKGSNCSLCSKVLAECLCVNDYLDRHFVHKLIKVFRYRHPDGPNDRIPSNELIYNIKREKRRDLLEFITDELSNIIESGCIDYKKYIITNVPRKKSRVLNYGHDHSEAIAKSLAKRLGIKYIKILKPMPGDPQKKVSGEERLNNARFKYKMMRPNLTGARVLLFDDIVTTGASMGKSAALIKALGAKEIVGVCLSIAYRDKYIPFAKPEFYAKK